MTQVLSRTLRRPLPGGDALALHRTEGPGVGALVVLQHGLCGNAAQTAEIFPHDVARLLTLECRGHGQSPCGPHEALSMATFADDVHAMILESGAPALIVGGISMGAALALRLAVLHPGRVRGLILARPAWSWRDAPGNMVPNLEVGTLLSRLPAAEARQAFLAGATAARLRQEAPDNLASLLGFFERAPLEETGQLLSRIARDGPGVTRGQVAALQVPALVLGCAQDSIHPLSLAQELAATLPDARFTEVTPKAVDRGAYVRDMQSALRSFIARIHSA